MYIVRCWCCACLSGSIINWFKTNLVAPDVSYDALNLEAERVPAGCEGLVCIDHFQVNFMHQVMMACLHYTQALCLLTCANLLEGVPCGDTRVTGLHTLTRCLVGALLG